MWHQLHASKWAQGHSRLWHGEASDSHSTRPTSSGHAPCSWKCGPSAGWAASKALRWHIHKDNSITHHHYNYHHHWHVNRMFPSSSVHQAWSAGCTARDRCQIEELSQQLSETTNQLMHISKVLDCLVTCHTPVATPMEVTSASITSSVSGIFHPGHAALLLQPSTASGEVNPSTSSIHISKQTAPASHTGCLQASWDLQDQPLTFQGHAYNSTMNQSPWLFLPSDLPWLASSLGAPAIGQHPNVNQQQHPPATVTTALPVATQHSTMEGTSYSRAGLANPSAMRPLPYGTQMATSAHSMATDIATMAKVIPNVLLKLQQRIIQDEFLDLS